MNLNSLKSFVTVAHLGNFTRAAERLNLSQPAISGHIRSLESELGVQLFLRRYRSTLLSEHGRALLGHAETVLKELDRLTEAAREVAHRPLRAMRIGFVVGADVVHMAPLLNRAGEIMPHVRIDVAQGLSGWVAAGVEAGRFQGGFFLGPTPPKGVHSIELTRLTYLLCIPVDWKRRVANAIPEDLAQLPWIWAPEGASYPLIVRDLFSRYGVTPRQVIEADREATIADLVASGIGVAILREPLARRSASEGRIEILDAYRAHVPLFFISPQEADQDMRTLRDCVLDVFDVEAGAD